MSDVKETELLPCPFCGHAPNPNPQNDDCLFPDNSGSYYQTIWCENCGAEGGKRQTGADAADAWNRRTPSPAEALPSQTSGAEAVAWQYRSRPVYKDGTKGDWSDWLPGKAWPSEHAENEERGLYLAKPASEPAGGGVTAETIARWKRDSELLSAIQDECWDVRFTSSPNADAGDYNVNIEIVGHFMAEPQERVVGENYNEDLRAALEQAMTAEPYPPARPVYDEPAALSSPASSSPAEAEALPAGVEAPDWKSRYEWLRDWYFRDGKRAEIHELGHIVRTTPEIFDAGVDAGVALALSSAPAQEDGSKDQEEP